jgi:tRNA 2-thiouridine synthesizing protein A
MSDDISVTLELDLRNLSCPMPLVQISKGVKDVAVGQVVKAVTSDPGALADFPAWVKTSGNRILKVEQSGDEISFFIERLK